MEYMKTVVVGAECSEGYMTVLAVQNDMSVKRTITEFYLKAKNFLFCSDLV